MWVKLYDLYHFITHYLYYTMASLGGFWEFIKEYNIAGMAVAFVMWAKVAEWVWSLVWDVLTPALLAPAMEKAWVANIAELATEWWILYWKFLASTIDFLVVAFIMYILVTYLVNKFFPADSK